MGRALRCLDGEGGKIHIPLIKILAVSLLCLFFSPDHSLCFTASLLLHNSTSSSACIFCAVSLGLSALRYQRALQQCRSTLLWASTPSPAQPGIIMCCTMFAMLVGLAAFLTFWNSNICGWPWISTDIVILFLWHEIGKEGTRVQQSCWLIFIFVT